MILSDGDIETRLESGDLVIHPLINSKLQVQPASVDLRLDKNFIRVRKSHVGVIDLADPVQELDRVTTEDSFVIEPWEFVLASTAETIRMPNDLVGRVEGRSSLGRLGLIIHVTAGFVDPGFEGQITLEMTNFNPSPLRLHVGMRVCQLSLEQMTSPAKRPYGKERGSKYIGEAAVGAVPSRYRP
jgi:dCTP deaminase